MYTPRALRTWSKKDTMRHIKSLTEARAVRADFSLDGIPLTVSAAILSRDFATIQCTLRSSGDFLGIAGTVEAWWGFHRSSGIQNN